MASIIEKKKWGVAGDEVSHGDRKKNPAKREARE